MYFLDSTSDSAERILVGVVGHVVPGSPGYEHRIRDKLSREQVFPGSEECIMIDRKYFILSETWSSGIGART